MAVLELLHGDCRTVMAGMPAASVDAVVCDPPYGLSFMGKDWDHGIPGVAFWSAALRVAKPGAHLLAFGGTRTFHRLAVAIEDAGWEIRDTVMWVYGSGFPKSHNVGKGWGTALKPAWEPIIVARKPLEGTVAANVLAHGTGAMNIDGCRVGTTKNIPHSPKTVGASLHTVSMPGNQGTSGWDANTGRWPANLIHDGSDEVLAGFPQSGNNARACKGKGVSVGLYGLSSKCNNAGPNDTGSAARFFYCAKASKADRDEGCEGIDAKAARTIGHNRCDLCGRQKVNVSGACKCENPQWVDVADHSPRRNHHPTVKPTALMRYLCKLVTPPSGTVLDPFMGSGSTGKAARMEGFGFIGIEQDAEYIDIARARIAHAVQSPAQQSLHI